MNLKLTFSALALACASLAAAADSTYVGGTSTIGKVTTLYARVAPGVYLDIKVKKAPQDAELWAEVRFSQPLADGRETATALLQADTRVERGDLVEMRFAHSGRMTVGAIAEVNRVTALTAKYYTAAASNFGKPQTIERYFTKVASSQ